MSGKTLIDTFIEEQQRLTAVERFALQHEFDERLLPGHRFRDLLPATPPGPGEQYAFEVDLDKCSGCKACVTACHSLNGLDEDETWREVGLLVQAPAARVFSPDTAGTFARHGSTAVTLQHVTTACHHCVDPACLNGCPVLAYDKDPATGIVRHLDDQCIGCQYCILKCPYDVPKYNARLGIVRKCDLCSNRLAAAEAPACAQACPNEAIRITKVQTETVTIGFRQRAATFLQDAPEGHYTLPTTRYVGAAGTPAYEVHPTTAAPHALKRDANHAASRLIASDHALVKPQPAHWPLVFMLVLTQASVGAAIATWLLPGNSSQRPLLVLALALVVTGLGASVFHLGRPLGAWRGFLNIRRSWMSREIVAFAVYPALLATALLLPQMTAAAALVGMAGVLCSAMIYVDTRRALWRARRTVPLFLLTTGLLGAACALIWQPASEWLPATVVTLTLTKLLFEISVLRHLTKADLTPMQKTALLITGVFRPVALMRAMTALVGGVAIPVFLSIDLPLPHVWAWAAFVLLVTGEFCERSLFFRTVVAPKMPGGLTA